MDGSRGVFPEGGRGCRALLLRKLKNIWVALGQTKFIKAIFSFRIRIIAMESGSIVEVATNTNL